MKSVSTLECPTLTVLPTQPQNAERIAKAQGISTQAGDLTLLTAFVLQLATTQTPALATNGNVSN